MLKVSSEKLSALQRGLITVLFSVYNTPAKREAFSAKFREYYRTHKPPALSVDANEHSAHATEHDIGEFVKGVAMAVRAMAGEPEFENTPDRIFLDRLAAHARARFPIRPETSNATGTQAVRSSIESQCSARRREVTRQPKSVLQTRGWRRKGNTWYGYYRTPAAAYRGQIVRRFGNWHHFYIWDPPAGLSNHPKRPCFVKVKDDGMIAVHFAKKGKTIDDGILEIERIMIDCQNLGKIPISMRR